MLPHTIVPTTGNRACLFQSLPYLIYDTKLMTREVLEVIMRHIINIWKEFLIMSHDSKGDSSKTTMSILLTLLNPSWWFLQAGGSWTQCSSLTFTSDQLYEFLLKVITWGGDSLHRTFLATIWMLTWQINLRNYLTHHPYLISVTAITASCPQEGSW